MKEGPDISQVAALIGDPARANILTALMTGKALTASELAQEAGLSAPTVSSHLRKLEDGKLIASRKQGRHKYFTLADDHAAALLEALMGYAAHTGQLRTRPGPRDPAIRAARVCYNHLAGEAGVQLYDSMKRRGFIQPTSEGMDLTKAGREFLENLGVSLAALEQRRAPHCRECLDWSERRFHLAGSVGGELLTLIIARGLASRVAGTRVIRFERKGKMTFDQLFPPSAELEPS